MDIFEAKDFDFLLPRRVRKFVALGMMIGIAFIPPIQRWYMNQIEQHAEHITRSFMEHWTPESSMPSTENGELPSQ